MESTRYHPSRSNSTSTFTLHSGRRRTRRRNTSESIRRQSHAHRKLASLKEGGISTTHRRGHGNGFETCLSNETTLNDAFPKEVGAQSTSQKVLGIMWDAQNDTLAIRCIIPLYETLKKRLVARRIASIYDPPEWFVPLLTKAKCFQQKLWKHSLHGMRTFLTTYTMMTAIAHSINGFHGFFSREFSNQDND